MARPRECVIDTVILQRANAPLAHQPGARSRFRHRIELLTKIRLGRLVVLYSEKLHQEYRGHVRQFRNEFVRTFFELLTSPGGRTILNWKPHWSPGEQATARNCRFPQHDDHLLRTAIRPTASLIITEDAPLLTTDSCIYRNFRVHVWLPGQVRS